MTNNQVASLAIMGIAAERRALDLAEAELRRILAPSKTHTRRKLARASTKTRLTPAGRAAIRASQRARWKRYRLEQAAKARKKARV